MLGPMVGWREPGRAAGVTQISPKVPTGPTLSISMILRRSLKKVEDDDGMRLMTELHALCPNISLLLLSSYSPHISHIGHSVVGAATRSPPR